MRKDNEVSLVIGGLLVLLGALLLLGNLALLRLEGSILWGIVSCACAAAFAALYAREHRRWWALALACLFGVMAVERLVPWTAYDRWALVWALCLVGVGVAFIVTFLRHSTEWWWLIPGGTVLTIGLTSLLGTLDLVPGTYQGVVFFAGMGLTFGVLYLLRSKARNLAWAQYPALSLLGLALLIFILSAPITRGLLLPLVLLGVGLGVVLRAFRQARTTRSPQKD